LRIGLRARLEVLSQPSKAKLRFRRPVLSLLRAILQTHVPFRPHPAAHLKQGGSFSNGSSLFIDASFLPRVCSHFWLHGQPQLVRKNRLCCSRFFKLKVSKDRPLRRSERIMTGGSERPMIEKLVWRRMPPSVFALFDLSHAPLA